MHPQTPESLLTVELREDVIVARFAFPVILGGQIAEAVAEKLAALVPELNQRRLLVDFANVRSVTSLMLGKLVQLNNAAKAKGAPLVIFNVTPNVWKIMEVTRLDLLLSVRDDEASALANRGA